MKTLTVNGRRWFQKSAGNTYNTAEIIVDGRLVHKLPKGYGYDQHYLTRAQEWLRANGYNVPDPEQGEPLWQIRDMGVEFHYSAADVEREKDL